MYSVDNPFVFVSAESSKRSVHMRTHADLRPYECRIEGCGRSFRQNDKLKACLLVVAVFVTASSLEALLPVALHTHPLSSSGSCRCT